jgi:hypothetical protein
MLPAVAVVVSEAVAAAAALTAETTIINIDPYIKKLPHLRAVFLFSSDPYFKQS